MERNICGCYVENMLNLHLSVIHTKLKVTRVMFFVFK